MCDARIHSINVLTISIYFVRTNIKSKTPNEHLRLVTRFQFATQCNHCAHAGTKTKRLSKRKDKKSESQIVFIKSNALFCSAFSNTEMN